MWLLTELSSQVAKRGSVLRAAVRSEDCPRASHSPDSEARRDVGDDRRIKRQRAVLDRLPLGLDFLGELLGALVMHQDLDARLVDIVAPAVLIVEPQHRLDVAQEVALGQERLDDLGEERRAAKPAADRDLEAESRRRRYGAAAATEIVDRERGAVVLRRADRDLELARQEREFRMQRDMLAQQSRPRRAGLRSRRAQRRPTGRW